LRHPHRSDIPFLNAMDGPGGDERDEEESEEEWDDDEEEEDEGDSDAADDVQLSPLHAAVEADDLARVQALVAAGVDIEEREEGTGNQNFRQTPLF